MFVEQIRGDNKEFELCGVHSYMALYMLGNIEWHLIIHGNILLKISRHLSLLLLTPAQN